MSPESLLYFSYGSNMSIQRLRTRTPSAQKVGVGRLKCHCLRFHKLSRVDGSAKCDVKETGRPDDIIYGVVFLIDIAEKPVLDQKEGLGFGYEQKQVWIEMREGAPVQAFTYFATLIDAGLKPFGWYKTHVLIGAREHDLPAEYIRQIEAIPSVADPDVERHSRELAIYGEQGYRPRV